MNRRQTLKLMAGIAAAAASGTTVAGNVAEAQQKAPEGPFKLPPLGYAFDALEPHIDTMTMRIHHDNHHAAYVANVNALVEKWPELASKTPDDVVANIAAAPEAIRTALRNNMGGHWNHTFFWELMTPGGSKAPSTEVMSAINGAFGDEAKMKAALKQAGLGRFGSGWAWLAVGKDKKLAIFSTPNQDTPHMEMGAKPILGIDVWEHAYYLKHQYRRGDYIDVWWNTVNWDKVAANFKKAMT
jgi:Fe-Mn family superoxide dismutase